MDGVLELQHFQGATGPMMTPEFTAACLEAVQVVFHDGKILSAGRAALFIFSVLGWKRTAGFLSLPPMIWFVEVAYSWVSNHRMIVSRILFRE